MTPVAALKQSPPSQARVVVGMSGGVDSAVAALLLQRAGYDVQGLFMSNWEDDEDGYCTTARDLQDARATAAELAIPLHVVSFAATYRQRVFEYFLDESRAGRTPNPDVLCNREIKFGVCLAYAARLGADRFATGHYARLEYRADGIALLKATDTSKDQSYFLHAVPREQFERVLFPLGELSKAEVRALARAAGLPVFDKPDSTGICFIGERPFREFLGAYLSDSPGPILSDRDEVLGTHRGLAFYTLGQRSGLAIGGQAGKPEQAWFVAHKDQSRNALIVVQGHDHPRLASAALNATDFHWLAAMPTAPFQAGAKVRHRQSDQACAVTLGNRGDVQLKFAVPQRAVTPGQFAVLYDGVRCLGGGVIDAVLPA
ncbi:MAG: tRNA 2-thiouridine(34) synthase MnmA [Pseudomonadales bacterium]|nr:tRNA 2-thiouridine(34) synthase MnmA [Pseudomonadales bacterium]